MNLLKIKDFSGEICRLTQILDSQFQLSANFGVELEFYLRQSNSDLPSSRQIKSFSDKLKRCNITIVEEKGLCQFETQLEHTYDILKLAKKIAEIKFNICSFAKDLDLSAIFSPKPFIGAYGSSMHFHLSLHDEKKYNVFASKTINTNKVLNCVIYSILAVLNQSLYFICGDEFEEYNRFVPNFMSPVNISWGANNRTTAIRIPESDIQNRRIEFRIPSASSDPQKIVFFLLLSTIAGLRDEAPSIKRVYGNAADLQYHLMMLFDNPNSAKENYNLNKIYSKFLGK